MRSTQGRGTKAARAWPAVLRRNAEHVARRDDELSVARSGHRLGFPWRVAWRAAVVAAPPFLVLGVAATVPEVFAAMMLPLVGLALTLSAVLCFAVLRYVRFPLFTVSNLLEALREGDYSLRGSRAQRGDALGEVIWEVNELAETLRSQRLRVEETLALLTKVLAAIELPILAFDDQQRVRLANPAAGRLLAMPAELAVGQSAERLGLGDCLSVANGSTLKRAFPGAASATWELRLAEFREGGRPQQLLVINDVSRALRREELQAWQRLLRVLGHELNNSLAPISSIAGTLIHLLNKEPLPADWRDDSTDALRLIEERAAALTRFVASYGRLARLPPPKLRPVAIAPLLARVCQLRQPVPVHLEAVPDLSLELDQDQIEQALINLLKNAAEAALEGQGEVCVVARVESQWLRIEIRDEGLGLASSDNLFVPFYTTKPGGSGIGLVLAQAIAEAHGGALSLSNRSDRPGCLAVLSVPIAGSVSATTYATSGASDSA